ncbi:zinc-dependent alcohol dehydrogenase [Paenibacillus glycinis]|uniref:Alcohol dehydrogenase catalytic domain-containing protein n=1 Tax=Paenibacillus glycinis TaxID=2697035 RepID=A0ABW9XI45_9BACL|nr:alcohol dehydrogenase catalytic domain-containing protein [Paenibacillus glycinis]NBD22285.1 alcohol dehydrogenase catalytic domain-containing protein [Paenibacillus glycinis]
MRNPSTRNQIWEWTGLNAVMSREAERADVGPGQVEVGIRAIGICGTDLHIMSGHAEFGEPPLPLGHELAGVVERVGAGVTAWRTGDRVCIDPLTGCGECGECLSGNKHRCPDAGEFGLRYPGGWQRFMVVPSANLYRLPGAIGFAEATQAETLHCCLGGIDKLDVRIGDRATVIGDGPTGLYFVQLLRAAGAGKVRLIGMRDYRLQLALELGADETTNVLAADSLPPAAASQDIVIDAAGTETSLAQSIELLKIGGRLLLFGLAGKPITVDMQTVVLKELSLLGSTNAPRVWSRVIGMMASGQARVKPLLTHAYPFGELDRAIAFARSQTDEAIKIIVTVDENQGESQ